MPSLLLIILVLSFSIEACNGRNLSFGTKTMPSLELRKDIDKATLVMKPSNKGPSKTGERSAETVGTGSMQILFHAQVSWSEAGRKDESKNPGFHLDYVGPRTHPPAHN